tara:strand:- start:174 stop:281 length:108 start_codon:yes stop_codon:yes gene_type:complete
MNYQIDSSLIEELVKDINDPYSLPSYPYTDIDYYD